MKIWSQRSDLSVPQGFTALTGDEIAPSESELGSIEIYVPRYMAGPATLEPIARMSALKIIQSPNAGYDDVLKVLPEGVTLCNAAGVHDVSTAELAMGLAITARRGFTEFIANQQNGVWVHKLWPSIADSRVAIVGAGHIGTLIASHMKAFQAEVQLFSRSGEGSANKISEFDTLLPTFDIVVLILPLNDESRGFMSAKRLAKMKDGSLLVNVARGPVVDTDALINELNSGRIFAGLDVTDPEPLPDGHPLWSAKNVIISPHVGGDSSAFESRGKKLVEDQLALLASGSPLKNVVAGPTRNRMSS